MKQNKYKYFEATLKDGTVLQTKATSPNKVTESYALMLAYHWINFGNKICDVAGLQQHDVVSVKGIK